MRKIISEDSLHSDVEIERRIFEEDTKEICNNSTDTIEDIFIDAISSM